MVGIGDLEAWNVLLIRLRRDHSKKFEKTIQNLPINLGKVRSQDRITTPKFQKIADAKRSKQDLLSHSSEQLLS